MVTNILNILIKVIILLHYKDEAVDILMN